MPTELDLLRRTQQILEEGGWRQGAYGPNDDPSHSHCLLGALRCAAYRGTTPAIYRRARRQLSQHLMQVLETPQDEILGEEWIPHFNDLPGTTVEHVLLAVKHAIAEAEEPQ